MNRLLSVTLGAALLLAATPLAAQDGATDAAFARFAPQRDTVSTKLDFSVWNTALGWFVLRMGPSLREHAPAPDRMTGSHLTFGHDSPYRLEGNRVAFSLMTNDMRKVVSEYRRELEALPDTVPIARLGRNEQLAYWINLHNAAMIEQLAAAYPVKSPDFVRIDGSSLALDETKFITVSGVRMSPKDIRTKIVYPNWRDPQVMYGFWHGEIGGPSISRRAFTTDNLSQELGDAAREFVNSLRGTQRSGDRLLVSEIYAEAAPFYFRDWPAAVRAHLMKYAEPAVSKLVQSTGPVHATLSEHDIADLSKGEVEPDYSYTVATPGNLVDEIPRGVIGRLLAERKEKLDRIAREAKVTVGGEEPEPGQVKREID